MDTYIRKCHSCSREIDCIQCDDQDSIPGERNLIWLCEECSPGDTHKLPTVDGFNPMEALDDLVQQVKQLTK